MRHPPFLPKLKSSKNNHNKLAESLGAVLGIILDFSGEVTAMTRLGRAYSADLRERIRADTGISMSWGLVHLWVRRLGLRLKKAAPRARTRY